MYILRSLQPYGGPVAGQFARIPLFSTEANHSSFCYTARYPELGVNDMSTRQADADGRQPRHVRKEPFIYHDHLDLVEQTIASLKSEEAAGTPIDHDEIVRLEEQLRHIRELNGNRL